MAADLQSDLRISSLDVPRGNMLHTAAPACSREFELIVRCAHLDPAQRGPERLAPLLGASLDWTSVLALAQRHGLVARVHRALRHAREGVPPAVRTVLELRAAREGERSRRLRARLSATLEALADARIEAIPLRCLRLADMPGDLVELDVLVRRSDVPAAWSVLTASGLEAETPLNAAQARVHLATQAARRFVDAAGAVVSLEWDVAEWAVVHGPAVDDLWSRAGHAKFDGRPCRVLDAADALVVGCLRGAVRRWQRLLSVMEVAEAMAAASPVDRTVAARRAERCGALRALALGAWLATDLCGGPTSARLAEAARDPAVTRLGDAVLADLAARPRPLAGPSEIARFHLRSREQWRDRLRYLVRRATRPDVEDAGARHRSVVVETARVPLRRALRAAADLARRTRRYRARQIARFVPTPPHAVDRMLTLAGVTADDTLLDLGCGDGAIVLRAAQRIGCRGVGIDFDAALIDVARRRARDAGLDDLVDIRHGDAREMDLSPFTAVCIYLGAAGNPAVRPMLEHGLRPGARLVSYNFDMDDWWPDDVELIDETAWGSNTLYLWEIPKPAEATSAA
jgi:protein-L-isoaspartate O-methyltransferase